jgi:hypothetical protein
MNKLSSLLTTLFIVVFVRHSNAQQLVKFTGNIMNGDIIAARVEDKLYVRDTLDGTISKLENGLYTIVRDTISLFDFAVFNSTVDIRFDEGVIKYNDSLNAQFYRFIKVHLEEAQSLDDQWQKKYPDAKNLLRVVFPQIFPFNGKTHAEVAQQYWDLSDAQYIFLKNSPFVRQYLSNFYDKMISQHFDSIFTCIETQMQFTKDQDIRHYYFSILVNKYETSKTLGHENVFARIIREFPKYDFNWVTDSIYNQLQDKAQKLSLNPVGGTANNFPIYNLKTGKLTNLNEVFGIYKILVFFDSDCGHCKEALPYYIDAINEFKDFGLTPIFVTVETTNEFLSALVTSRGYNSEYFYYNHLITPNDFRLKFDIPSTPQVYILNSSNKILAKNIPTKELNDFLKFLLNN